ncbi:phage head morphogenesis protein [Nitrosomonas communis]|uniref:Phage Mu protein F like protein n=1 Tax=Nitrosomonas communis TaxID=44574 RepID=A0A1I4U5W0_9PROT|nr:phage minor head protein [Nitrosomonas communis]SFM84063.1 Phage Mu protein F like protein [Nitrosomonas communis]
MPAFEFKLLPPADAIEFFRQKGYAIGFSWEDIWQSEHQAAFTVAKAMQLDILRNIREAVDEALVEGTTFETFRKSLELLLMQKGWWGRADMQDPLTGEIKNVQLGSTRRLKVIYDTNLRTAHSEGQWQRIQRNKETFPYLKYDANNSEHPRLEHSAWDGLVLPVDHPFWKAHYPIRAYRCKCGVTQLDKDTLDELGLKPSEPPKEETYTYINKRSGEVQSIPKGVDPSFNYPPGGRLVNLKKMLSDKIDRLPDDLKNAASENEQIKKTGI